MNSECSFEGDNNSQKGNLAVGEQIGGWYCPVGTDGEISWETQTRHNTVVLDIRAS